MSKWIEFFECAPKAKRRTWLVAPKENAAGPIGKVQWYSPWRRYCFFPSADSVYEEDCLRDIAAFIESKTREHKAR